eukprot:1210676-Prymnesium_polylepis.2
MSVNSISPVTPTPHGHLAKVSFVSACGCRALAGCSARGTRGGSMSVDTRRSRGCLSQDVTFLQTR